MGGCRGKVWLRGHGVKLKAAAGSGKMQGTFASPLVTQKYRFFAGIMRTSVD
jgi:hypothetical protein